MNQFDIRDFSIPASPLRVKFGEIHRSSFLHPGSLLLQSEHEALIQIESVTGPVRAFVERLILDGYTTCFGFAELQSRALRELTYKGAPIVSLSTELIAGRMPHDVLQGR